MNIHRKISPSWLILIMVIVGVILCYMVEETRDVLPIVFGLAVIATALWALLSFLLGGWAHKVRRRMLSTFLMEYLGALARLSLPLTQALGSCSEMLSNVSRRDLADLEKNLHEGLLIGDALANVPRRDGAFWQRLRARLFSFEPFSPARLVTAAEAETLRVGEMSGDLAGAFKLVLEERRRSEKLRTWLTVAFLYPAAVLVIVAGLFSGILVFIIPKFKAMFAELSVELPPTTGALVASADYLSAILPWLILAAIGAMLLVPRLRRIRALTRGPEPARDLFRRAVYFIPYKVHAFRRVILAEFCVELAMLLRVGAPAHRALRVLADGTMNPWFRDRVRIAAELCERGEPLATALDRAGLDRRAAWFGRAAGEAAELADALSRLAKDYQARISWTAAIGGRLLPPLLILCIGSVVGFVVISVFMPMVKLIRSIE